jgi:peptidoglycan/LPS O-acetylase OafA/YrhL
MPFIDALKGFGSQLIVLHHLAFYGPMSDWTHQLAPDLVEWFSQDARMAVQIFLVVAGFLAARSLAPQGHLRTDRPLALLWQRFVRVSLPLMAALLLAVAVRGTRTAAPQPARCGFAVGRRLVRGHRRAALCLAARPVVAGATAG